MLVRPKVGDQTFFIGAGRSGMKLFILGACNMPVRDWGSPAGKRFVLSVRARGLYVQSDLCEKCYPLSIFLHAPGKLCSFPRLLAFLQLETELQ